MKSEEHDVFKKWGGLLNELQTGDTPTLNRFAARYKLSRKFKGLDANLSVNTLRGYSTIFHVFLAYSAFESLVKGADELKKRSVNPLFVDLAFDKHNHPMIEEKLASDLRKIKGLAEILIEYADRPTRIVRLKEFFRKSYSEVDQSNENLMKERGKFLNEDNLLVVASAIRNVVAHGQLSATGANAISKKNAETLDRLARFVEEKAMELFQKYVDALWEKYVPLKQFSSVPKISAV